MVHCVLPWNLIFLYLLFGFFVRCQYLQARNYRGANKALLRALNASNVLSGLTEILFLLYYGLTVVWWAPLTLFAIKLACVKLHNKVERLIGSFEISLLGFLGWPACAVFMFFAVPRL